jgi:hypothetical protein
MAAHVLIILAFVNMTCSNFSLPLMLGVLIRFYECLTDGIAATDQYRSGKALVIFVVKALGHIAFFDFGNHSRTSLKLDLTKITRNEESVWGGCFRCAISL